MKWTVDRIRRTKGTQKVVCLTAYDYASAQAVDAADIPLIIVGDSLGMTVLGYDSTIPVTLDDMIHHTRAVARGAGRALVVADMPFLSYQISAEQAVDNAGRLLKEAHAGAVKIEGGAFRADTVRHLIANGIPVMGHIGLTPQSVHAFGGYKVQGKTADAAEQLKVDAMALSDAGAFALVLEGMPAELATEITVAIPIPTIGIGAGAGCDGQVLVFHDVLGLYRGHTPKYVKQYADLGSRIQDAFAAYKREVESGAYPGPEHSYSS